MEKLGTQHAAPIWESLCAQQDELATLLGTALGGECTVDDIKEVSQTPEWREQLQEVTLAVGLLSDETGIVLAIPQALITSDRSAADQAWQAFAEKLQSEFLAEHFVATTIQVATTPKDPADLVSSLAAEATCLELAVQIGGAAHKVYLAWPLADRARLFDAKPPQGETAVQVEIEDSKASDTAMPSEVPGNRERSSTDYRHSLMQIKLPVMVTLARQKLDVKRILAIAPGSLIQFEKFCEDMLDVEAADHKIALGETVKVGDKFGIRITSLVMPPERFVGVKSEPKAEE